MLLWLRCGHRAWRRSRQWRACPRRSQTQSCLHLHHLQTANKRVIPGQSLRRFVGGVQECRPCCPGCKQGDWLCLSASVCGEVGAKSRARGERIVTRLVSLVRFLYRITLQALQKTRETTFVTIHVKSERKLENKGEENDVQISELGTEKLRSSSKHASFAGGQRSWLSLSAC